MTLDVTGTLPTIHEVKEFLANKDSKKRQKKIDELLTRPAYAAWWTTKINDFQGNSPAQLNINNYARKLNPSLDWYNWVYRRVSENRPYDEIVEGIVMGTSRSNPEQTYREFVQEMASYFRKDKPEDFSERENMPYFWARRNLRQPEEKAMAFAYSFLGVRIQCAQCHKHPFDQWTQADFNSFKAFFENITYTGNGSLSDAEFNPKTLQMELEKEAGYNRSDPKQNKNRLLRPVAERRLANGQPIPWQEVFIKTLDKKKYTPAQIAKIKKRNPNFNSRVITPKVLGG